MKGKEIDNFLREVAAHDRAALLTEKDVLFLKSIGIDTDLETLRAESIKNWTKGKK